MAQSLEAGQLLDAQGRSRLASLVGTVRRLGSIVTAVARRVRLVTSPQWLLISLALLLLLFLAALLIQPSSVGRGGR